MRKLTTEEWVQKARTVHGDKYDYSKVDYKRSRDRVCIICPIHGEFWQIANSHIQGQGCPKCGKEKANKSQTFDTNKFIEKAKKVHGNKYNYSKVEYKNSSTKVCIICPKHGEFWQTPAHHLWGQGCPKCFGTCRRTTEEFIQEAQKIHGNKYIYSKTIYGKNNTDPVEIICPIHGSFWQTPVHHINSKCGCPKCNKSHGESIIEEYLKENNIKYVDQYGINVPENIRVSKSTFIDFYLPDFNVYIEYNGIQHYIPQKHFGGQLKFNKQIQRDKYLRKYCKENNINLIEIPYTEKDIKKFLEKHLNENTNYRRCPLP